MGSAGDRSDKIYNISERDFWSSIRTPSTKARVEHLREAVRLGRQGRQGAACAALDEYYRQCTVCEWTQIQSEAKAQAEPSRSLLKDLLGGKVVVAHGLTFQFRDQVDFTSLASGRDALAWLQGMGWCRPMLTHFLKTEDAAARDYLIDTVLAFYRSRSIGWLKEPVASHYAYGPLGYCAAFFRQVYVSLIHSGDVPPPVTEAILKYVLGAGRAVYSNVKRFIIHNIHTAGCRGLFKAAVLFPEFAESDVWKDLAVGHLVRHSKDSFFNDGCHQERCWGYGWHTLNRLTDFYDEAQQQGGLGGKEAFYLRNLRNAYRWFAKTSGPGFLCPGFGDDGVYDCTPALKKGMPLFPKGTGLNLGVDRTRSYFMRPSGFVFMRNGDGDESVYANVTFGTYAGWHAHFDRLSLNLRLGSTLLLEELGRFGSYDHPMDHIFRSPEAHNQLLVDAHPYDSRFQEGCQDVAWQPDGQIDYFSAVHHAYRSAFDPEGREHRAYVAAEPLVVRRTVVFVKNPGYLVLMDSAMPQGGGIFNRAVSGWWHSPQPFNVLGPTSARTSGRTGCLLLWAHPEGLRRIETGWDYDAAVERAGEERRCWLRARRWFEQSHTGVSGFTTVLFPFSGRTPSVKIHPLDTTGGMRYRTDGIEVDRPGGRDVFLLNPERLAGFSWRGETVKHRAVVLLGRRRKRVDVK